MRTALALLLVFSGACGPRAAPASAAPWFEGSGRTVLIPAPLSLQAVIADRPPLQVNLDRVYHVHLVKPARR